MASLNHPSGAPSIYSTAAMRLRLSSLRRALRQTAPVTVGRRSQQTNMKSWRFLVLTVLISTEAQSRELPENKSYTKVSSSPYNNDSFEPDGKGRTISQDTKAFLAAHPKTPKDLETHTYSSENLLGKSLHAGIIDRNPKFPLHTSITHIPSSTYKTNPHISILQHASHVNNAAGILPAIPIANAISSATSAQVVSSGTKNIAIPNDIQTATTTQYHSQDELGQYTFGYSGGLSSRHETSDVDGTVRGSYSYVDPYGEIQTQHYVADDDGFRIVAKNILSSLLRKKRSLINTKYTMAPVNTVHFAYHISHLTPRLFVPAQTISQPSYLNGPSVNQIGLFAYGATPVRTLTNAIHPKEPVSLTGYGPSVHTPIHHVEPLSITEQVPINNSPEQLRNHPPKAKALVHYENNGLYQNMPSNVIDYSKITLFRADGNTKK